MPSLKIVVTGPVGSGKTTFVQSLSGGEVVTTDEHATNGLSKGHTTVALDHGTITVAGQDIALFGTPGQERFDYMWDLLAEGTDGVVLLIPADRPNAVGKAETILDYMMTDRSVPLATAVTRIDLTGTDAVGPISDRLNLNTQHVAPIDARDPDACASVLDALLDHVGA
jgi:hypothetical protein